MVIQSQVIGMQSSLDRILNVLQSNPAFIGQPPPNVYCPPQSPGDRPHYPPSMPVASSSRTNIGGTYYPSSSERSPTPNGQPRFPPLPGFAPPVGISSAFNLNLSHSLPFLSSFISPTSMPRMESWQAPLLPRMMNLRIPFPEPASTRQSRPFKVLLMPQLRQQLRLLWCRLPGT